jgi:GxxExxY protein
LISRADSDHPLWDVTHQVIGAAYEVHKHLGNGFLESVYAAALAKEISDRGLKVLAQHPIKVSYKGLEVGTYFADLVVDDAVICELKAVKSLLPEHEAQLIHYLKATGVRVGILLYLGARSVEVKSMLF